VSGATLKTGGADARAVLVLAHGAGAGMRHAFLEAVAEGLAARRIATLRYEFPYMEQGKTRPDPAPVCEAVVRAAVGEAARAWPGLPLFAGGKSMGGRMTTQAAAKQALRDLRGIVLFGFPLHAPRRPASARGEHLVRVPHPMLFLQGTRDDLADLSLLGPIVTSLGNRASLHVVDGADHSFHVLRRSGRTDAEVLAEILDATAAWIGA
jgi:uncharacterized protein